MTVNSSMLLTKCFVEMYLSFDTSKEFTEFSESFSE